MKREVLYILLLCLMVSCGQEQSGEKTEIKTNAITEEQQLKDAVKKYPDSMLLKEDLMQYYADQGDYPAGLKIVNEALATDSNNARLWDISAALNFQNGDTNNAIHSFEQAIRIIPLPEYLISLATLYAQTKNPLSLAIADKLLAANKSKADKEAFFIKGLYFSFTNDKQKAIVFFDKCLALNYTFMDAYREKSIALYDLGKYNEALEVLNKALTLQNNYDEGYYYSGKCLEKLNRIPEAIESYQNALKLDPDYVEAKDALKRLGTKN